MRFALLILAIVVATGAQAPSQSPAEKLTADKPITTSAGATFNAPGGWALTTSGPMITVEAPEGDSRIVIYDSKAAGADAAIAEAWGKYNPQAKRTVRQKLSPNAREGWEESHVVLYETSPNERAVVQALARRF